MTQEQLKVYNKADELLKAYAGYRANTEHKEDHPNYNQWMANWDRSGRKQETLWKHIYGSVMDEYGKTLYQAVESVLPM